MYPKGYPITYSEIKKMVRRGVLPTRMARSIIRKAGVRRAQTESGDGLGAPILAIPPVVYVTGGTTSDPV